MDASCPRTSDPGGRTRCFRFWTGVVGGQKAGLAIPDSKRVREDVQLLREIIEAKGLRPVIDRTYPLAEIVEAHRYVDTEQKTGSVLIRVAGFA